MTILQMYPILIPVDSGPINLTEQDIHLYVGVFVIMHVIWIITLIRAVILYRKSFRESSALVCTSVTMFVIWGLIAVFAGGAFVSDLIFNQ